MTSALTPASTEVLPSLTSAEASAVDTTPSPIEVGRASASGRPSGRRPRVTNWARYWSG